MLSMLIVDDEHLVRLGLRSTVEWSNYGIEIIGEAEDGEIGVELALIHNPDIILTDIRMPFMDGLEFMSKIREKGLESRIIVLSGYDEFAYVQTALDKGASAYLLKPVDNQQLIETVRKIAIKIKEDKSTRQYYDKLKNELTGMKKHFVRELISGDITDRDEIRERIGFLDIPLDIDNNYLVIVRINKFTAFIKEAANENVRDFKEFVLQNIADLLILHTSFIGIVVDTSLEEWVVIIHAKRNESDIESIIKERCKTLTDKVGKKYNQTVSIGISNLCGKIEDINKNYLEVCTLLESSFVPNINYIVSANKDVVSYRREITEAMKYMKKNFHKDISVEAVANEIFISPSHLMHLFRDEVGKTFYDCLIELRIEKAKELLKDSNYKIYEVCQMVGYSDPKYFSQVFKRIAGVSPSEYIK